MNPDGPSLNSRFLQHPRKRKRGTLISRLRIQIAGRPLLRRHGTRLLKGLGAGVGYAAFVEPRWIERTHVEFDIPGLDAGLDGYRIVHLTDIHHNFVSGRGFLERIVDMANALDPDLVVLTGDFITHDPARLFGCFRILSHLRAPDGLLATRGNHDYRAPFETMRAVCEDAGVRLLENEHVVVEASRHRAVRFGPEYKRGARLVVAGVGDLWEGTAEPARALAGSPTDLPRILLSHNPRVAEILTASQRVALQLSGHTHGGQVRPFNQHIPAFADGGGKYHAGIVQGPHTIVYVSRGVGTSALHFRWNCRPEIALVTLKPELPPHTGAANDFGGSTT